MNRLIATGSIIALIALTLTSCQSDNKDLFTLSLDRTEAIIQPDETLQLEATTDGDASTIVWSSSNPQVASVDEMGVVTPQAFGETEIIATMGSLTAKCAVSVDLKGVPMHATVANFKQFVWDYETDKAFNYRAKGKPMIIDFWATWCGPCMALGPKLEEYAKEFEGKAYIVKVEITDNMQNPYPEFEIIKTFALNEQFAGMVDGAGNLGLPTLILIDKDGETKVIVGSDSNTIYRFLSDETFGM